MPRIGNENNLREASDTPVASVAAPVVDNSISVSKAENLTKSNTMPCDCPSCKRDNILNGTLTANCGSCSTVLSATVTFQIMGDKSFVCDVCVTQHYTSCVTCQKLHKKTDTKKVKTENGSEVSVCGRCFAQYYRECAECHGYFDRHNVFAHGEKTFCKPCFNKTYQVCQQCNTTHPKTVQFRIIRERYNVCDSCYSYYGTVGLYESKPKMEFQGKPPHYYGVELECELANQKKEERGLKAEEVSKLLGDFAILKEDGSIRCGFEICTQPGSLDEHKVRWEPFFTNLPKNLVSFNAPNNNCGLHIHCSKKPLSLLTIAKIVVFVNDDKNQPFIEAIAGRKPNNYFQISKKKHSTVHRIGNLSRNERYEAVNLVNKDTIEFRIFKGTLKRESFYKAIEFCDAIIHFCMMGNHGINYCRELNNFIDYVGLRAKDYPHLYAFICAKILKRETKLTQKFGFSVVGATPATPPATEENTVRRSSERVAPEPTVETDNQI